MFLRTTVTSPAPEPRRYELLDAALERGLLPDALLRAGSLFGAWDRERRESAGRRGRPAGSPARADRAHVDRPIAEKPEKANEQHYELPAEFLGLILGPRRKYSGLPVARRRHDARPGRGGDARPVAADGRGARRDAGARPRLRLGLAVAVAGRAVPGRSDHRRLQLPRPAAMDRVRARPARADQPRDHHRRRQRLRAARAL